MIDEKKITEAVNAYIGYPKEVDEGIETSMRRDAFKAGAEWFANAIWHDANKEPEHSRYILAQRRTFIGELRYYKYKTNSTYPWKLNVRDLRITKWCYIEDILPLAHDATKGGEK